jgi:MFS transporter, BCD family, chlorophyll transporter
MLVILVLKIKMLMNHYSKIIVKLGMIRFATSLLVVLLTNVLNRVLIVEFQTPAALITFIFAFQHLATPSGLIAGYYSDRYDQGRQRRTPFIVGGMLLSLLATPFFPYWGLAFAAQPQSQYLLWLGVCLFTLFGVGTTVSATAVNALLVDQIPEARRGAGMALVWLLTLAGFVVGSTFFYYLFPGNQINRLEIIFWLFTGIALAITLWSVQGIEISGPHDPLPAMSVAGIGTILEGFVKSNQARLFFLFLAATVFSLAMQTFILTPYGGEILMLPVGETSRFGIYTAYGTLVGMGTAYWWQKKRPKLGNKFWLIAGLLIGAAAFGLLSLSSWRPQRSVGEAGLWLLGLSKGFYNAGISFLTMRLAHPAFSGVFMGLWNLISGLALAAGEMTGGFFLGEGVRLGSKLGVAYALVFLVEGLGLLGCLLILKFLHVETYWRQIASHLGLKPFPTPEAKDWLAARR